MKKGFTLLELLVVISIIGLLSSIIFASINQARVRAENTRVQQEIGQWIRAINLYRLDNNNEYPIQDAGWEVCLGGPSDCSDNYEPVFYDQIGQYINTSQNPNRGFFVSGGEYNSIYYAYSNPPKAELVWYLKGNVDCAYSATKVLSTPFTSCTLGI